ncbi:hypothetical protein EDB83DRAFT_730855 [Lactarius deliciosus]|nr:hypothetical protein EDB83DRAFT_730855 [Lactarius deliciosus]
MVRRAQQGSPRRSRTPLIIATINSPFLPEANLHASPLSGEDTRTGNMPTFRTTASGPLVAFIALSFMVLLSHAQSQLPACAAPCAASAAATTGCSLTDPACICSSDPFLLAYDTCIYQPENCLNADNADIQPAISFYVDACDGDGPGFPTIVALSLTTGSGTSSISSTILTLPPPVLPTPTSTPSTTSASRQTVSSPPTNAAASLPVHARAAAALMVGGVGALVAVAM